MRRAAGLVAIGLTTLCLSASSSASPIDWKSLPYFQYSLGQMLVTTDATWSHARAVDAGVFKPQPLQRPWEGLRSDYIWTSTCTASAQSVAFSKTVLVPGTPTRATGYLAYAPSRDHPYASAQLLVNGTAAGTMAAGSTSFSAALPTQALHAFRYGANTITIRVRRTALPKGQVCHDAKLPRLVGILGSVYLWFGADIQAIPSDVGRQQVIRNMSAGSNGTINGVVRFRNLGPSSAFSGRITANFGGDVGVDALFLKDVSVVDQPFSGCVWTLAGPGSGSSSVTCSYDELRPGQQSQIRLFAGFTINKDARTFPPTAVRRLRLQWSIGSDVAGDTVGGNDRIAEHDFVLCGTAATDPVCR